MSETDLTTYLAQNPRMIGVLFTLMVLLSQAGTTMAACGKTLGGP